VSYGYTVLAKRFVRLVTTVAAVTCVLMLSACGPTPKPTAALHTAAVQPSPAPSSRPTTPSAGAPHRTKVPAVVSRAVEATVTATTRPKPVAVRPQAPPTHDVLTGGTVTAGPLIAAKIDNTSAGFPQFGVAEADIVYVEQVEGGLTRLVALFHSVLPDEVGPIRSVRSTDSELLSMYGKPGLAFSGGAGGPLSMLAATAVIDLSPDRSGGAYWRSQFGDGTHNLHVDLSRLAADRKDLGEPKSPGFQFAAVDGRLSKAAAVRAIDVTMQAGRTRFVFESGRYTVSHRDTPYIDHDGAAVRTDNVLVQRVRDEPDGTVDSVGSPSYISHSVGSGSFTLYRDGKSIAGSWKRPSATAPTSYSDASGAPVLFKPGKTWVLLAPEHAVVAVS